MWANNQWGSTPGSIPGYNPMVFSVEAGDSQSPTIESEQGSNIDIAWDNTMFISPGETIVSVSVATSDSGLSIVQSEVSNIYSVVRIINGLEAGKSAELFVTSTTSSGRIIKRGLYVVSRQGPPA